MSTGFHFVLIGSVESALCPFASVSNGGSLMKVPDRDNP